MEVGTEAIRGIEGIDEGNDDDDDDHDGNERIQGGAWAPRIRCNALSLPLTLHFNFMRFPDFTIWLDWRSLPRSLSPATV